MAEMPTAPPLMAACAGSRMFVMFGVILAHTGIFATWVTQLVTSSVRSGCSPISEPILRSVIPCGHEKLSSNPSTPVSWTMRVNSCQRLFSYSSMIDAIRMFFGYSFFTCRNSSSQTSIGDQFDIFKTDDFTRTSRAEFSVTRNDIHDLRRLKTHGLSHRAAPTRVK